MSQSCPLCGKNKSEETLFCEACSRKIKKEYEVNIPERDVENSLSVASSEIKINNEDAKNDMPLIEPKKKKKRKTRNILIGILIFIVLLVGAFYFYKNVVRANNVERAKWEATLTENTIVAYLSYMDEYPNAKHYLQAQENLLKLKEQESAQWKRMRGTDNATELRDFLKRYPESPYTALVKVQLDSLTWVAALNENTADGYSNYMMLSQSGEFKGDYFSEAEKRYEMLFQSYPVNVGELDSIRTTIDGFYTGLSAVNNPKISQFLAPIVYRFFDSGTSEKEKIVGELSVAGAKTKARTIRFKPNLESVRYEKTFRNNYKANVPLIKSYAQDGVTREVAGYIVHLEMNPDYKIIAVFETKPYPDAP